MSALTPNFQNGTFGLQINLGTIFIPPAPAPTPIDPTPSPEPQPTYEGSYTYDWSSTCLSSEWA
jgi:hypothetical protein